MSFQATSTTSRRRRAHPRQFIELAQERGFDKHTKATPIVTWLKEGYGLGQGHAITLVHVITKGPQISTKHVGTDGTHSDATDTLWLDGKATNPNP